VSVNGINEWVLFIQINAQGNGRGDENFAKRILGLVVFHLTHDLEL